VLAILAAGFAALTLRTRRLAGVSPYGFGRGDDVLDHLGRIFRLLIVSLYGWFIARAVAPGLDALAGTISWIAHPSVAWFGFALIAIASILILVAEFQMGQSWRIGLSREATELVTRGVFRFSRNPVFLGMLILLLGAGLAAPSAVTTALLVGGYLALSVQIRLEEAHLKGIHGDRYEEYSQKVRRWI
jgi:protein-S-isoprenylcysteine O-methyltransferase Ste14